MHKNYIVYINITKNKNLSPHFNKKFKREIKIFYYFHCRPLVAGKKTVREK